MSQLTTSTPQSPSPAPHPSTREDRLPWLAALAIVPILASVYQTLVLTDVTSDVIRKGIEGDKYAMIWTDVCWGAATLYGVFAGLWAMPRFGARIMLQIGLVWFAVGNLLCGGAWDVPTLSVAKLVEGIGKGLVIILCRSTLYKQFDRMVIVAVGFYGIVAYATRPTTPLVTALVNDSLSWRWIFWVNVPMALLGIPLVRRFIRPDRPPQPIRLKIDWIAVTMLVAWAVSMAFCFGWYRKWGGWSSNEFSVVAVLAVVLPVALTAWVAVGISADEHLRRIFRVRVYVLAMCCRMLLLVQLLAVMTLMASYLVELRDYPRVVAGWVLAPATVTMAVSTFLTTYFHRRSLRHFWLVTSVVGCAACLWWMSSVDNFTSKQQVALMMGCWGLFLGLLPPSFLQDEIEGLDRRDALYAGALAVVALIVPIIVVPTLTSTTVSAWSDRALDAERLNLSQNRPEVQNSAARVADYYQQRGVEGPELSQMTSTVLGAFAKTEATGMGIQRGLQFLSLVVGGIGVLVTGLLVWPRKSAA
jgi:DHA2 family multidrug resistance protein